MTSSPAAAPAAIAVLIADSNRMQAQLLTSALRRRSEFHISTCPIDIASILHAVASTPAKVVVLSLNHSALMHLGDAPHPSGEAPDLDLPLARQTIDLLGLLEEKTKGNLTGDEERLLTHVLFDLRMRFVELSKENRSPAKVQK